MPNSGAYLQTLKGQDHSVRSVVFSGTLNRDNTVKMLEGHGDHVNSVTFSPDLTRLASALEYEWSHPE